MSIKRQLVLLIISAVVLASFFAGLHGYRNTKQQMDAIFTNELITVANFILSTARQNDGLPASVEAKYAFQVIANNRVISRSNNTPEEPVPTNLAGFSERSFSNQRWYLYTLVSHDLTVVVGQPVNSRVNAAESVLVVTLTPIVFSVPIIGLLIYFIVAKSLNPLLLLSSQLTKKDSRDLTPVDIGTPPTELTPVVERLNNLLNRLDNAFEREKQLTANAAHELRTPVSVLTLTAHNIAADFAAGKLSKETLQQLAANVDRMAHVIEQMIALFRFTPEQFNAEKKDTDLEAILQEVIAKNYDSVERNEQNISLESEHLSLVADKFALMTLFQNLIGNAIKYSGPKATIAIRLQSEQHLIEIVVEDSGKGVSENEYKAIFERFYRVNHNQTREKGSGLGLTIAHYIVELHDGEIFATKSQLGGLAVHVRLPMSEQSQEKVYG
ncbi:sensor histidine kinase [Glaciecola sp. 1036]|uniref:sensor histidine kinase n=1 Tax=Alteromonadaceae TaxID=72275 RepID=UPI003D00D102